MQANGEDGMSTVEKSVDVEVPVRTAYDQWTQFTSFPRFMEGVDRVDQLTDTRTHWVTSIGGVGREFDAEITEQSPDERVAWTSLDGPKQAGLVTFHPLDGGRTTVRLHLEYEPDGLLEAAGDKLGLIGRRIEGDLGRFKDFIEGRGAAEGGWRGEVDRPLP
jgi:uncharacterized membrane protein